MDQKRPKRGPRRDKPADETPKDTIEKVVFINRCAKVVKGGRRFSFSALIVIGDMKGRVGIGFGKANEVSEAIRKGSESARKAMVLVSVANNTIPHEAIGEFGATITFVANIPGETQTISSAIYSLIQTPNGDAAAFQLMTVSIVIALLALFASEWFSRRALRRLRGD